MATSRDYKRDDKGRFASTAGASSGTRGENLTKRIQLRDEVGQERRRIMRETQNADVAGKLLRELRAAHRKEAAKFPVIGKR